MAEEGQEYDMQQFMTMVSGLLADISMMAAPRGSNMAAGAQSLKKNAQSMLTAAAAKKAKAAQKAAEGGPWSEILSTGGSIVGGAFGGPAGAAAGSAAGNALGGAVDGEKFDFGKIATEAAMAGGSSYMGGKLMPQGGGNKGLTKTGATKLNAQNLADPKFAPQSLVKQAGRDGMWGKAERLMAPFMQEGMNQMMGNSVMGGLSAMGQDGGRGTMSGFMMGRLSNGGNRKQQQDGSYLYQTRSR